MSLLLSCLDYFSTISSLKSIDLLDSRVHFALHLLDICIAGCSFLLCCASPRTSPCLGRRPLVCVCLLLALLLCLLLALLLSVLSVIAPDFSCSSRCPRTRVAFHFILVATGSWAVVLSRILTAPWLCFFLTTGSLAVVLSVLFFWLVSGFPPKITTQHCALRDWWFAVGALDPREGSLQQRVLLCKVWSERFFVPAARRCSLIPLCHTLSCVHLHNESFHRAASCHCVVFWFVRHCWTYRSSCLRLALTENMCVSCQTLIPFTRAHDLLSLWASSPASQCRSHCGRLRLRVLFLTLLSCIARGCPYALEFC